jgi:hypothetical protein
LTFGLELCLRLWYTKPSQIDDVRLERRQDGTQPAPFSSTNRKEHIMTAAQIAAEAVRLDAEIEALEDRNPGRTGDQWKPWQANDDALSMEHWALVQRRLNLKWERPTRQMTTEQKAAASQRLNAARTMRSSHQPAA